MKNRHDASTAETPEQLIAHISQLMNEAEAMIAGPVVATSGGRISEMRAKLEAAQSKLVEIYGNARRKFINGARQTDEAIRAHPYESLAIALGIGVLIGALLRRSNAS